MTEDADVRRVQTAQELWGREADEHVRYGKGFHWVESPIVLAYINKQITGDSAVDWLTYIYRQYIQDKGVQRILSLGCGGGGLERHLHQLGFRGQIDACDFSEGAIEHARTLAAQQKIENIHYFNADLNHVEFSPNTYGIILSGSALHHVLNLEHLLDQLRAALVERGMLIINEYVGPFKLQWTPRQTQIIDDLLRILPPKYRRRISDPEKLKDGFEGPSSIRVMDAIDPTESARSDEILALIQARFSVKEEKCFGGTLLQMLLQDIVGNFDPASSIDTGFLRLLIYIEKTLISERVLASDFVSLVAEKSKESRLPTSLRGQPIDMACELRARDTRILNLHEQIHQLESELRRKSAGISHMQEQILHLDARLHELTEAEKSAQAIQAGAAWQTMLRLRQLKERRFPAGSRRRGILDALAARLRRRLTANHDAP